MNVVDAQVHLWAASRAGRRWPPYASRPHSPRPPTADELLGAMDASGVHRAVLVPPSWEGDRNDVVLAAARAHPDRFAAMGRFPAHDPARAPALARWPAVPGLLGVRLTLHAEPWRGLFRAGAMEWFFDAEAELGLPVAAYAPGLLPQLARVARRRPRLRLLVDHLGLPLGTVDEDAYAPVLPALRELAGLPNVAVKATALPCHTAEPFPFPATRRRLRQVVDAFGAERVFWGSDWTRLPGSYAECLRLVTEAGEFRPDERAALVGGGLSAWLGWPPGTHF